MYTLNANCVEKVKRECVFLHTFRVLKNANLVGSV